MTRFITLSMLAAMLGASIPAGFALAEDHDHGRDRDHRMHEVCTTVTKCHREDGRRMCHQERECKMVSDHH